MAQDADRSSLKARHAELAVNLAGAMAAFIISTWKDRSEIMPKRDASVE